MAVLVKLESSSGQVLFEAEPTAEDLEEIGIRETAGDLIKSAQTASGAVAETVKRCTREFLDAVKELTTDKQSGGTISAAEMEFGIKVTGEANVIVAKGTAEANIKIVLTWDFS
jgi:uncharacterized protein with ATP-grasp and redox domains